MKMCQTCKTTKFGLVTHNWWWYKFCSTRCKKDFLVERIKTLERLKKRFLGSPPYL